MDGLKAYHGPFDNEAIEKIALNPEIAYIEPNSVISALPDTPTPLKPRSLVTQDPAAPSLARISHRQPGFTNYVYDSSAGSGSWVYLLATGVNIEHSDFGGRATHGYTIPGSSSDDVNGVGTAAAGVIAGETYGAAKLANIISVKVVDDRGSGTITGVINGIQWAVNDIVAEGRVGRATLCLVVGGGFSISLNRAVDSASAQGVPVIVPSCKSDSDAGNFSPGSAASSIVIAGLGLTDTKASFSNYGPCVDYFVPGVNVMTTWIPGNAFGTLSGTTLPAGIAAGVAAYLQGLEHLPTVDALSARLTQLATVGLITGLPANTVNRILYNGSGC